MAHAAVVGALGLFCAASVAAETIPIQALPSPVVVDGNGADWADVAAIEVRLHRSKAESTAGPEVIWVKGGVYGDYISFYFEWQDSREDIRHKPWLWDPAQQKYVKGPQREDRLAIQFATGGDYTTDWLAGAGFTADMWHWKASRSNPLGLAHDKSTHISPRKLLRSRKVFARDGKPIYIARPSDSGSPLYTTNRYHARQADIMPKYVVNEAVQGSVADVEARGVWREGKWHLEVRRKLDTGHGDDVVFVTGQAIAGGIAVFDHTENDDHAVSGTLTFQF